MCFTTFLTIQSFKCECECVLERVHELVLNKIIWLFTRNNYEYLDLNLHTSNTTLLVLMPCKPRSLFRTKMTPFQRLTLFLPSRPTD
jgi:hypothetical protein